MAEAVFNPLRTRDMWQARARGIALASSPVSDPKLTLALTEGYWSIVEQESILGQLNLPLMDEAAREHPNDVISLSIGNHRDSDSNFASRERVVNFYPHRLVMTTEDADKAQQWALRQCAHYPVEDTYAQTHAGVHSLVVRVEWGADPDQPYEIDTEPGGYGLLPYLSPTIRGAVTRHQAGLGSFLWSYMPRDRLGDSFEHFGAPVVLPAELPPEPDDTSGLLLPFMRGPDDLSADWRSRSIFPVSTMEDKTHLAEMGLMTIVGPDDDAQWERILQRIKDKRPLLLRELVGSCAVGMYMYEGGGQLRMRVNGNKLKGGVTASRMLTDIDELRGNKQTVLWRDYIPPTTLADLGIPLSDTDRQRFDVPEAMCAIKRYYIGFDAGGGPHTLGGIISARSKTMRIHGANDAITVVVDPPDGSSQSM